MPLCLGYKTLVRRTDLCAFRFDDIYSRQDGCAAITLRFDKNAAFINGRLIPISDTLHADIRDWAGMTGGAGVILRRVHCCGDIGQDLKPEGVTQALKELQRRAGIDRAKPLTRGVLQEGRCKGLYS